MIEVHLYVKLRRFAKEQDVRSASIACVRWEEGDTVSAIVNRLGISETDLGSNLVVNGQYANFDSPVPDGARIGLFSDDMQLLYKWYYAPTAPNLASASANQGPPGGDLEDASASADANDHEG